MPWPRGRWLMRASWSGVKPVVMNSISVSPVSSGIPSAAYSALASWAAARTMRLSVSASERLEEIARTASRSARSCMFRTSAAPDDAREVVGSIADDSITERLLRPCHRLFARLVEYLAPRVQYGHATTTDYDC